MERSWKNKLIRLRGFAGKWGFAAEKCQKHVFECRNQCKKQHKCTSGIDLIKLDLIKPKIECWIVPPPPNPPVMGSGPIFLDLDPIRSIDTRMDLSPIWSSPWAYGPRSNPDLIQAQRTTISIRIDPWTHVFLSSHMYPSYLYAMYAMDK